MPTSCGQSKQLGFWDSAVAPSPNCPGSLGGQAPGAEGGRAGVDGTLRAAILLTKRRLRARRVSSDSQAPSCPVLTALTHVGSPDTPILPCGGHFSLDPLKFRPWELRTRPAKDR